MRVRCKVQGAKWLVALLGLFLLASCDNSLETNTPALSADSGRSAELFMPDVETVTVDEDFSKDPQYASLTDAFEAIDTRVSIHTQGVNGSNKVQIRTHTFSNGETYTYSIYNGIIFDADVILGTSKELQDGIAIYEAQLTQGSDSLSAQGAMYKPFCASQFLFACGERRGGGWPGNVLYVDTKALGTFPPAQQTLIRNALANLDRLTDIQIGYRTTGDRVMLTNRNDGCYAVPGRSSAQPQNLNLGAGCVNTGTVLHEFGHALGLMHEHQRTDRDSFIVINTSNLTAKGIQQMAPKNEHDYRTTYDYASVMHYPRTTTDASFAKVTREPILTIVGSYRGIVGGNVLTARDIQAINARY